MNCHTVRALCELFGRDPKQLDADAQSAIDCHLDVCPACREWRRTDRQVDAALATAMKNVATPAGLERRIRDRLSAARPPRSWGRIAGAAAVAAIAVIAFGIWMMPQTIDLTSFASRMEDPVPPSRESVERFSSLGYRVQAPSDLMYDRLRAMDVATFQNRQVPRLTFAGINGGRVSVYILSAWSFSLPTELDGVELPEQFGRHVLAQRSGGQIYVYEWTSNALADVSNLPL
jgi:hypothetical protein